MDIQSYIINDCWLPRLSSEKPILTIYDSEGIYRDLLEQARESGFKVIDTSGHVMGAYLKLADYWNKLNKDASLRLLIYRNKDVPKDDERKKDEPYQAIIQTGDIFPIGANDTLVNITKRFLPNKIKDIDELERNNALTFENINNLQEGASYPILESLTGGHSPQEIIIELLKLDTVNDFRWLPEWKRLVKTHFSGLDFSGTPTLLEVQERLWNYLLFSEFVYDLPQKLPATLTSVPRASDSQKITIYDINRKIRNSIDMRDNYIEAANRVSKNLKLESLFQDATDLGNIVTFLFENRVEFEVFTKCLETCNLQDAEIYCDKNRKSIWYSADKSIQSFWDLAKAALLLYEATSKGCPSETTRDSLLEWYASEGYKADQAMRSFMIIYKQATRLNEEAHKIANLVDRTYRSYTDRIVKLFQEHTYTEGFTNGGLELNLGAFDRLIFPLLKKGKRVVMIMADAFRYEMGKEFVKNITVSFPESECAPSLAYIPTVTRFGMAALLPESENKLELKVFNGTLEPVIGSDVISNPSQRIKKIKDFLGEAYKVEDSPVETFNPTIISKDVQLLVLRSTKIDTSCESCDTMGLGTMELELRSLIQRLEQTRNLGFDEAYIFADHGFMLQTSFNSGDKIPKPTGNDIVLSERRCIAGNLNESEDTFQFSPMSIGIDASFPVLAFAKGYGVFEAGKSYFHEGLSLQENVVPIVHVKLSKEKKDKKIASYKLSYKGKDSGVVRIQRPLIGIIADSDTLFGDGIKVKMEVRSAHGTLAGEIVESEYYDPHTGILTIPPSEPIRQPIELIDGIIGDIVITLLDPDSNVTLASMVLNTDLN